MATNQSQILRDRVARLHVGLYIAFGIGVLVCGLASWQWSDPLRFASFVAASALGSVLKVRLPGLTGTTSVSSLFVLISLVNLSLPEALVIAVVCMMVQCTWNPQKRPRPVQVVFSVCVLSVAVYVTAFIFTFTRSRFPELVALGLLSFTYFCLNTFPIAAIIGLTEGKRILSVWSNYRWTL